VAEIAGYFSRFSLTGGKVNLCAGGGIVPVLSERDGRMETADAPADT
jgi:carbamate kinase